MGIYFAGDGTPECEQRNWVFLAKGPTFNDLALVCIGNKHRSKREQRRGKDVLLLPLEGQLTGGREAHVPQQPYLALNIALANAHPEGEAAGTWGEELLCHTFKQLYNKRFIFTNSAK